MHVLWCGLVPRAFFPLRFSATLAAVLCLSFLSRGASFFLSVFVVVVVVVVVVVLLWHELAGYSAYRLIVRLSCPASFVHALLSEPGTS